MSDVDDTQEVGELTLTSGVTSEMADALLALRRTPVRPEHPVVSNVDPFADGTPHRLPDERRELRANAASSWMIQRSIGDYFVRFSQPTTTFASTVGASTVASEMFSSVSDRRDMTSHGERYEYGPLFTGRKPYRSTANMLPSTSIVVDSRTAPITSVVGTTELPLYSSASRNEIAKLQERLEYMESLLERSHVNIPVQSDAGNQERFMQLSQQGVELPDPPASTRRPGGPPSNIVDHRDQGNVTKPYLPHVKLGVYKGDTSLETFLAKFENCSKYLCWSERDRFFHLSNALDGAAGQVLWDAKACSSVEALVQLLRNRFGNQNQMERYRAELKARRRRPGESLQKLYQDICKLMALAYPGQSNELSDVIAKDSFLDALDDLKLRREILVQQPQNLDTALSIACRLEAYDKDPNDSRDMEGGPARGKNRHVRVTKLDDTTPRNTISEAERLLAGRVDAIESKLDALLMQGINPPVQPNFDNQPFNGPPPVTVGNLAEYQRAYRHADRKPARFVARDVCRKCFQKGHWAKFCPQTRIAADQPTHTVPPYGNLRASKISDGSKRDSTAVYLRIRVNGRPVYCLLDTGCEHSVINSRLIAGVPLEATEKRLFAANKTEVPVKGLAKLRLTVHEVVTELRALVSDAVEDVILGVDWLTAYAVQWNFGSDTIWLQGKRIPLSSRPSQSSVRRLYVSESMVVPPGHMADVPVTATLRDLRVSKTDWATDARQLKKNVLAARTLIAKSTTTSAVRVVNVGTRPCELNEGQFVGNATPVEVTEVCSDVVSDPEHCVERSSRFVSDDDVPKHVTCLLDNLPADMNDTERQLVKEFVCANADVFSKSEYDIGRTHLVRHRIDTGDNPPFKQPLRRHPMAHWPLIDKHVEEMLANDIIEPTASPWASNIVLIRKKTGDMRFCVDYRRLNDVTRKDSYPLPRIEDCLTAMGGASYFTTLDLRAGYWQTAMDERDADKTAFVTRRGVFKFKVLSFGLANAPALFQRLMDYVLSGLTWEACLVYLDDIIIWADSFEEHIRRLSQVLQRLREADLKLKPSKCRLFQRKVGFLGHVISADGIEPDPAKISSVVEWPVPRNVSDVRAFIGLASYYRRHVKGFADIARPLHELTRKRQPFQWTDRQQKAFNCLKSCLVSAPILAAPLDNCQYVLDTDASDIGLGAVLQQEQPDGLRVIAYASRALSNAELSYCTTKKEMLALTYGLKVFRQYLLARDFLLRTDHAALTNLRRTPEPVGQQARWLDLIAEFNFVIQHRPGTANGNADGLSRRVCGPKCRHCSKYVHDNAMESAREVADDEETVEVCQEMVVNEERGESDGDDVVFVCATQVRTATAVDAGLFASDVVAEAQGMDETIAPVKQWISEGTGRPEWKQLESMPEDTRTLWGQFESLEIVNNVLYRRFYNNRGSVEYLQLIVPRSLRDTFLKLVHEGAGGHFAIRKTQEQVQRRAYWPGWRRAVERFIRQCLPCAQYQGSKPVRQGALQSFEANGPGDRYCIDLVGPYPRTKKGKKYILTVSDAYTRYLICVAIPDKTAICVSRALVYEVFFKIGCPRSLQSDLGTEFQNQVLDGICNLLGIHKLRTTVHRPSANGRCERSHRTISACLAKLVAVNQTDWDEKLPLVVFAMNCAKSDATNFAPFELMYGRLPRMPVDMVMELPGEGSPGDYDQYVEEFADRLREANKLVQQQSRTTFSRMKRHYDAKVRNASYTVGQYVLFFYPRRYRGRNPKLARPNIGPFRILRRLNAVNFIIAMTPRSRRMVVHIDKLKPWHGEDPKCWEGIAVESDRCTDVDNAGGDLNTTKDDVTLEGLFQPVSDETAVKQRETEPAEDDVAMRDEAVNEQTKVMAEQSAPIELESVFTLPNEPVNAAVESNAVDEQNDCQGPARKSTRVPAPVTLRGRRRSARHARLPARYRE